MSAIPATKYYFYPALTEDENAGWIWIYDPKFRSRNIVQISCDDRKLFCQVRQIDQNFLRRYEQRPAHISDLGKAIVINEWYRDALGGRDTGQPHDLRLETPSWRWWGTKSVKAACHHPDLAIRLGTRLGVLGVWLGLVGICLALPDQMKLWLTPLCVTRLWVTLFVGLAAGILGLFVCAGPKPASRPRRENGVDQDMIAILGWGSLLWDWTRADGRHSSWQKDGPELKLEFSRISTSRNGALTLVIDPEHGMPTQVAYDLSQKLRKDAMGDLRRREETTLSNIGYVRLNAAGACVGSSGRDPATIDAIRHWAAAKQKKSRC